MLTDMTFCFKKQPCIFRLAKIRRAIREAWIGVPGSAPDWLGFTRHSHPVERSGGSGEVEVERCELSGDLRDA